MAWLPACHVCFATLQSMPPFLPFFGLLLLQFFTLNSIKSRVIVFPKTNLSLFFPLSVYPSIHLYIYMPQFLLKRFYAFSGDFHVDWDCVLILLSLLFLPSPLLPFSLPALMFTPFCSFLGIPLKKLNSVTDGKVWVGRKQGKGWWRGVGRWGREKNESELLPSPYFVFHTNRKKRGHRSLFQFSLFPCLSFPCSPFR